MNRTFALVFALVVLCLVAVGCVRTPGGVAPSNIPLSQDGYTVLGSASASDCKYNLFGILPVSGGNQLSDAVDEALRDRPGAGALINITVESNSKYFILWSQTCTEVRATAVALR